MKRSTASRMARSPASSKAVSESAPREIAMHTPAASRAASCSGMSPPKHLAKAAASQKSSGAFSR
jgi:hypothetical protein